MDFLKPRPFSYFWLSSAPRRFGWKFCLFTQSQYSSAVNICKGKKYSLYCRTTVRYSRKTRWSRHKSSSLFRLFHYFNFSYSDLLNKRACSLNIFHIFEDHFYFYCQGALSEYLVLMY